MSGRNHLETGAIFDAIREDEAREPRITEAAFRPIAEKYDIPSSKVEEVRRRLNGGASAYCLARSDETSVPRQRSYQDVKREVNRVGKLIEELKSALETLSEDAAALYDNVEHVVDGEMLSERETRENSSFGHRLYRSGEGNFYLNRDQIVWHIGVLENMTKHILTVMKPTNRGGRPLNEAMSRWVDNVYFIWTRTLGRRFKFDQHQGEPTVPAEGTLGRLFASDQAPAADFCWQTLRLIDPRPNWSEFCTAMRQAVRLDRPGRGRSRAIESRRNPHRSP